MIPKLIHQTWKDDKLPDILQEIVNHNKQVLEGKGYRFKLWTDEEIEGLISREYPNIVNVFKATVTGVQRGDIARMILLHHYGGVYIDLDILLLRDLEELISFDSNKLYITYEPEAQTVRIYNRNDYLCNAFMASNPANPLLGFAIQNIYSIYQRNGNSIFARFDIFGGDYIKSIYDSYIYYRKDAEIIEERERIFPINDPKFNNLPTSKTDWDLLKHHNYLDRTVMVHYWIHGDFESKKFLWEFKPDVSKDIQSNVYEFFCKLYPQNASMLA